MENTFSTNLRALRKKRGITQEQLADAVGISPQAVSKWETSSYPDAQLLPAVADYLGVTIDELFGRKQEEPCLHDRIIRYLAERPCSFNNQINDRSTPYFRNNTYQNR